MAGLTELVEPMIPALRRYARAMVREPAAADDLVQDCLERVVGRWHQLRTQADVRSWVFTILHNLALNSLRREKRRGPHLSSDAIEAEMPVQAPHQEHGLELEELLAELATLPEDQRSVLLLVSVEGLSYAQCADVLGIPVGTVMSRLSRARARLLSATDNQQPARPRLRRVK